MKIPGLDILKTTAQAASNPVGFAAGQVSRIIETDETGEELPEIHAFQVKLDRIAALLSFIAERADPEGYEQVFGDTPQPAADTSEAEPQPENPSEGDTEEGVGAFSRLMTSARPENPSEGDTKEDEGWL